MSKKESFAELSEAELTEVEGGCRAGGCYGGGTVVVAQPTAPAGYQLSTSIPGAPYAVQTQQVAVVGQGGCCNRGWGGGWGAFFRW